MSAFEEASGPEGAADVWAWAGTFDSLIRQFGRDQQATLDRISENPGREAQTLLALAVYLLANAEPRLDGGPGPGQVGWAPPS